jgi:hypothetical protein
MSFHHITLVLMYKYGRELEGKQRHGLWDPPEEAP